MNEADLKQINEKIRARMDELERQSQAGKDAQSVVELDQQSIGRLSRMDALQNQAMAKAHQVNRDLKYRRLLAALKRIESQEYGFCEDCGEPIPNGRLELDLAATRCVSCASG
nr:TraR/DksA C4-type zinc finger protein [Ruegeria faecimaris]